MCFQVSFKERSALVEHVDHDGCHCCPGACTAHRAVACVCSKVVFDFSRYQDITHSIHLARKQNLGLKSCDGNQELLNYLRSDLIEVATRLQKGGLGYVDVTPEYEARVSERAK